MARFSTAEAYAKVQRAGRFGWGWLYVIVHALLQVKARLPQGTRTTGTAAVLLFFFKILFGFF